MSNVETPARRIGDGTGASEDMIVNGPTPRPIPAPTVEPIPPKRVVPEWMRRRNAGQLQPKDMTGSAA